jgi:hypothetical protein
MSKDRHFNDEDKLEGGGGILQSSGLREFDSVQEKVVADGLEVEMSCPHCGRKKQIVVEWPELIVLAQNASGLPPLLPEGWYFSPENGTAFTALKCNSCGKEKALVVHLTPEDAQVHVKTGMNTRLIPPPVYNSVMARVAQQRARG